MAGEIGPGIEPGPVGRVHDQAAGGFILDKWYVGARLSEIRRGRTRRFRICGRDILVTRTREDTCQAHMSGCSGEGDRPVPCRTSEGLVWLFIASHAGRHGDPGPVPVFGGPQGRVRFMEKVVIPADQDDAIYGLLDPAHTPFVHRSPIWRGNGVLKEKHKSFQPSPFGFTMMPHAPVNSDIYRLIGGAISVRIEFRLPGLRAEYIENERHRVLGLTTLTPLDEERTVLRQVFYWNTPVLGLVRPFASLIARPFLKQDVDIMALRRENLRFGGKGMLLGDSDRQFLWYLSLKRAWEACGRCRHSFRNPVEPETLRWRT